MTTWCSQNRKGLLGDPVSVKYRCYTNRGSSNGRIADSESVHEGSTPSPRAINISNIAQEIWLFSQCQHAVAKMYRITNN